MAESDPAPTPTGSSSVVAARERSLAERLLEDESLRGGLDDQTWAPVQDWLLREAHRAAVRTEGLDDAAAEAELDRTWERLRDLGNGLSAALEAGTGSPEFTRRVDALGADLRPPVMSTSAARKVRAQLQATAKELAAAGADGPTAAARLVAVLETAPAQT
jgi:hypothetical protein